MAQYLILLYENETEWEQADKATSDEIHGEHNAFAEYAGDAVLGGNALQPTSTATTVRTSVDGGEAQVTDGPFVETKEALGGYYLVEARDLDHALDLAKHVPARFGGVEVRPIMVLG